MDVEEKEKKQQRKWYGGHMGGDSTCILADRLGGSELGSGKAVRVRSSDGHNHHELHR